MEMAYLLITDEYYYTILIYSNNFYYTNNIKIFTFNEFTNKFELL